MNALVAVRTRVHEGRETLAGLHCRRVSNGRHRQTYIRQENYVLYIYVNEATMMARKKFNEEVMLSHTSEIKLIDSRFFLIRSRRANERETKKPSTNDHVLSINDMSSYGY